jgi:hypothetical protein
MKDLNVKPETLQLLEEDTEKTPEDKDIGNTFLNKTKITQEIRTRIDK